MPTPTTTMSAIASPRYRMTTEDGSQKEQINMRLSRLAKRLLKRLALARGVSQTDIVEMMIREEADRRGIVLPEFKEPQT